MRRLAKKKKKAKRTPRKVHKHWEALKTAFRRQEREEVGKSGR